MARLAQVASLGRLAWWTLSLPSLLSLGRLGRKVAYISDLSKQSPHVRCCAGLRHAARLWRSPFTGVDRKSSWPGQTKRMVESRCGAVALGRTYLLPPLSSGGALVVPPWLRYHIPLIEPDMQISRIRLSDKTSRLHPRHVVPKPA